MQESEIQENQETEYLDLGKEKSEEQEQGFNMDFGMSFNYGMSENPFNNEMAFDIGELGFIL